MTTQDALSLPWWMSLVLCSIGAPFAAWIDPTVYARSGLSLASSDESVHKLSASFRFAVVGTFRPFRQPPSIRLLPHYYCCFKTRYGSLGSVTYTATSSHLSRRGADNQ